MDIIIAGGGTSGVAAAVSAAKSGCKVLIIEKNSFLGGTQTASLVTPMMKNIHNTEFMTEILTRLQKTEDSITFKDGNSGWFNPEMLKCVLDDITQEHNIEVLFDTTFISSCVEKEKIKSIKVFNKSGLTDLKAKYFIDATGDADIATASGIKFAQGEDGINQCLSLRFILGNVNIENFSEFLTDIDPNSDTSPVYKTQNNDIHLSTAYTSESKAWNLKPFFEKALKDGVIKKEDADYFQLFTIPGQKNAVAFNCPRIFSKKSLNPLDAKDISYAYKQGRVQIRQLTEFCRKYLPGFENSYISQIAPMLGVRDSRRIKGVYELTKDDILEHKKFDTAIANSNYPIDIHSQNNNNQLKQFCENDFYEIPIECTMTKEISNLFVVGRSISADFTAQSSLRIQPNCISIGEEVGKYVAQKIKEDTKNVR